MALRSSRITSPPPSQTIVVIGGGIGGLTAGALLAQAGHRVTVLEQAQIPGGCASTFQRRGFTFDVGATQVAGLEPGGIHHQIFDQLELDLPAWSPCDPACAVYLPGETSPISVWRDPLAWHVERQRQFPGSDGFWQLLTTLFQASWEFQGRDPILPPRTLWDLGQLFQAMRPSTLITAPYALSTVGDALGWFGLGNQQRLRRFLDLQLKLYSQVDAQGTALLYGATALGMSQAPQGLAHVEGSMQVLSDRLVMALKRYGGTIHCGQRVNAILTENNRVTGVRVQGRPSSGEETLPADQVVANVTVQNLLALVRSGQDQQQLPGSLRGYDRRVQGLPPASGAFVVYLGVTAAAIPSHCPPHLQFLYTNNPDPLSLDACWQVPTIPAPRPYPVDGIGELNSLFVSVSRPGDDRAPAGCHTLIASSFTDVEPWQQAANHPPTYRALKAFYTQGAIDRLGQFFDLHPSHILHQEAATPCTFAHYTHRHQGSVGGLGQRLSTFGPFGFSTRTPLSGLWLVGDCTHPGEGTAGVSYSAWTMVRQLQQALG